MELLKKHISQALVHLLFWILFTFVSLFVFSEYYWSENPFLQYLSILILIVYTNNFIILPFFVKRKQYFLYAVLFILISFLATQLYCNVFTKCGCSFMKCLSDYLWQTIVPLIFFSFVWILFKYLEREKEIEKALQERTELELRFLKSQINPHVLFNNLNTVYSYAIEKPEQTPDLILKLSDNLKHVLYESTEDYIPLDKELQYIDNYIDFQKIRTQGIKNVSYNVCVDSYQHKIAPLLLITIIENAFKHSPPNSHIIINIKVNQNTLECFIQNDISKVIKEKDSLESIGLSNLKKRLNLLYHNNYNLKVLENETFTVTLHLNLDL
jgi:two-component system LytT family sensor kinase